MCKLRVLKIVAQILRAISYKDKNSRGAYFAFEAFQTCQKSLHERFAVLFALLQLSILLQRIQNLVHLLYEIFAISRCPPQRLEGNLVMAADFISEALEIQVSTKKHSYRPFYMYRTGT
jgi:hypothetical protein